MRALFLKLSRLIPFEADAAAGVHSEVAVAAIRCAAEQRHVGVRRHPGVADVGVAGVDDPQWGQRVTAWVVPTEPSVAPTLPELRSFLADQLPGYMAPRDLIITDALPRTAIGKLRRAELSSPDS